MQNGQEAITIRQAVREDVGQIADILVEDWKKAYRGIMDDAFLDAMSVESRYAIEVRRYPKYIVAADGGEILGYAWNVIGEGEGADCEIVALYVRYGRRRSGIGKALFQRSAALFRAAGKRRMIVWCLKENAEARRFYEQMGGKAYRTGTHSWGGREYEMISYLYQLEEAAGEPKDV